MTYVQAATRSVEFVTSEVYITDIFMNTSEATSGYSLCDPGPAYISWRSQGTSTIGFLIEAMSILQPHAAKSLNSLLNQTISSALDIASSGWFDSLGVLPNAYASKDNETEGEDGDMYFLRGIAEAYRLGPEVLPSKLRDSMKIVLGVHYNIIRDHATLQSNVYGRSWTGTQNSLESFNLYNQAAAAQVLVDGISVFRSNTDGPISSDAVPTPSATDSLPAAQSQSKPSPGTIAGATVGTVVFLLILGAAILLIIRRRRRRHQELPTTGITPFHGSLDEKQATPRRKEGPEPPTSDPSNEIRGQTNDRSQLETDVPNSPDTNSRVHERTGEVEPVEMSPAFPDMVRAVYQRLWQPEGLESPPEYRSTAGEPAGR
ncbi:hypothetical protein AAF712_004409 [Marasmius tenuissimus]|uniref:Glycoside hydrolase family 76 protein n=1 Tax=Marasmius tenuissimus TaxID=585030 RepID=A0ABR3A527_9AGAR